MYGEGGFRSRGPRTGSGGGFGGEGGGFAPVKVGEELDVRIEAVGEKGDGIARKRGFVLFVPNTKEGDEVRIRITKVLRKVGFAESIGAPQGAIPASDAPRKREERESASSAAPQEDEPVPQDSETFGEESSEDTEASEPESEDKESD
jgi:predicted RNA-binding protein with TRAM domain